MAEARPSDREPTIGFICPLYTEIKAVRATWDAEFEPEFVNNRLYWYGEIGSRVVVAVQFLDEEIGAGIARWYAEKLVQLHPQIATPGGYCFLVGIAGGIWSTKRDVRLGDVVIATSVLDWRSGKLTQQQGFVSTKYPEYASDILRARLPEFLHKPKTLRSNIAARVAAIRQEQDEETWEYPGKDRDVLYNIGYTHVGEEDCQDHCDVHEIQARKARQDNGPMVHRGLIASGPVVLKDAKARADLQERMVLAVEMEAADVPKTFITIRGISDYADSHKNDMWQPYAAATAAACTRLMIDMFTTTIRRVKSPYRLSIDSELAEVSIDRDQDSATDVTRTISSPAMGTALRESRFERLTTGEDSMTIRSNSSKPIENGGLNASFPGRCYEYELERLEITLSEGAGSKSDHAYVITPCRLFLDVSDDHRVEHVQRRLRIRSLGPGRGRDCIFWLPLGDFQVRADGSKFNILHVNFSNCKTARSMVEVEEPHWDSVQNAEDLNVSMTIHHSDGKANDLMMRLLHLGERPIFSFDYGEYESFRRSIIRTGHIESSEAGFIRALFIWPYHIVGQIHEESVNMGVDTAHIGIWSDRLDFAIDTVKTDCGREDALKLTLRFMRRVAHCLPEITNLSKWLDLETHKTSECLPPTTKLTKGDDRDSTVMECKIAEGDLSEVMNRIIGPLCTWTFCDWFEVQMSIRGYYYHTRWRQSHGLPCHLTVWASNEPRGKTRLLFRGLSELTVSRDDRKWACLTLPQRLKRVDSSGSVGKLPSISFPDVDIQVANWITYLEPDSFFPGKFPLYQPERVKELTITFPSLSVMDRLLVHLDGRKIK